MNIPRPAALRRMTGDRVSRFAPEHLGIVCGVGRSKADGGIRWLTSVANVPGNGKIADSDRVYPKRVQV